MATPFKAFRVINISVIDTGLEAGASDGALVPLSDRFNTALATYFVDAGQTRDSILASANDPRVASDPSNFMSCRFDRKPTSSSFRSLQPWSAMLPRVLKRW